MKKCFSMLLATLLLLTAIIGVLAEDLTVEDEIQIEEDMTGVLEIMPEETDATILEADVYVPDEDIAEANTEVSLSSTVPNAAGSIPIDATHFPDEDFRSYVYWEFDIDGDDVLSEDEYNLVTKISLSSEGISSLKGIEWFPALTVLYCEDNLLTNLDVSKCTALTKLWCQGNQLTSLDVSKCTSLSDLRCESNQLTSLNVGNCLKLEKIDCSENQLKNLNASGCSKLVELNCNDNQMTSLNVSNCSSLETIYCYDNQLTNLDVSGCSSLQCIYCPGGKLTILDVSDCSELDLLDCSNNNLTTLNVSGCSNLHELFCESNELTSLNIINCSSLENLGCVDNKLKSIDITGVSELIRIVSQTKPEYTDYPGKHDDIDITTFEEGEGFRIAVDRNTILIAKGKILYAPLSYATITVKNQTYTGKVLTPDVTVKLGDVKLRKGTDYTVTYSNNKAIGTATVTIKGKGGYTGTCKATFKINPKSTSGLKLTAGKKITASWKKTSGVTGYQIQYGMKKNFSDAKTVTVKKAPTVKKTLSGLKAKKTYYVRVRTYKTVKKVNYYSAWTSAKKIKTK